MNVLTTLAVSHACEDPSSCHGMHPLRVRLLMIMTASVSGIATSQPLIAAEDECVDDSDTWDERNEEE